jgi:VDE lipocalin domain-containing protein
MKNNKLRRVALLALAAGILQGCVAGKVYDSAGEAVADVDVVAIGDCAGEGCAANETYVVVGNDLYTGYQATTNSKGEYFYDPYGEVVAPEDAMGVHATDESEDGAIQIAYSKSGYQQILLNHVPDYNTYVHPDTGKNYLIARAPDIYLCREDETDSDGDSICDESEKRYGTSHGNVDTDNDGVNDNIEIFQAGTDPGDLQQCVFAYCTDDVIGCTGDAECNAWLQCMEGCGEDEMLCPTQCGAFYQSPYIDSLSQCALGNGCAFVEFPDLPACNLPAAEPVPVGNIDGFWWVSAINGNEFVLYDDCQRFILEELNDTEIDVENSTLVTVNNSTETRVVLNNGLFTRTDEGYMQLVYDNWAGYRERYHPYHVTENVMIMHVCSVGTDDVCHDYGTLVLTRTSIDELSGADRTALDAALQSNFQSTLDDFRLIRTQSCPNAPGIPL